MKKRLDTLLSLFLTLAAVAMATAFVWGQLFPSPAVESSLDFIRPGEIREPQFYPGWRAWLADGNFLGPDSAPVFIIVFSDLECPGCRRFHEKVLKGAKEDFGPRVAVSFIHLPLSRIHRFAEVSAVAAECAAEQDGFNEYVDVLYRKQDSIGLKSWESYALEAGVSDPNELAACVASQRPLETVKAGRALADEIRVTGTPTVFVNGWRFPAPPSAADLSRVVQAILAGREPFTHPG